MFKKLRRFLLSEIGGVILLFLLALFLRTYSLSTLPWAFHTDELVNGYVGRFILLNGKDVYGNSWPLLYFDKFGDYRVILPMYIAGISTFLFGVNEFAVRFPTALFGALAVFPFYALAKLLLKDKKASLLCVFLLVILPWHLVLSRATSEGIIGLTVFISALYFVLKGVFNKQSFSSNKQKNYILYSLPLFFITYFLYPPFRLLTPLVFLPLPLFAAKKEKKFILIAIAFFIVFTLYASTTVWGKGRYLQTSLFSSQEVRDRIHAYNEGFIFGEGHNSYLLARIFHNKAVGYGREFASLYASYFSPDFLFLKGGLPYRYAAPNAGVVFVVIIIFIAALFIPSLKKEFPKQSFLYVLFLLFIAPLPSAVTIDDVPNVNRVLFLMIPILLLAGWGFLRIQENLSKYSILKKSLYLFLFAFLTLEFVYFLHQYIRHTASYKSVLRNDGNRELARYLSDNKQKYKTILVPYYETMPLYYLFYTNNFDKNWAGKFKKEIKIDKIENIELTSEWCPSALFVKKKIPPNTLIVDSGDCQIRPYVKGVGVIMRKDSTYAFRLFTE